MRNTLRFILLINISLLMACSSMYYSAMDSVGIPKRDIMVHRVEKAKDSQHEAKEQILSTMEQFTTLTNFDGGDLEATYKKLNSEYEDSVKKSNEVKKRIADIEDVSDALLDEWKNELNEYSSASLKRSSQKKLQATEKQYHQLIAAMKRAEAKMDPVLAVFKDQVLYLKHNLNAEAISSLKGELGNIQSDVSTLIASMNKSISEADAFIKTIES